ncbi:hypothetical protein [Mycobacterium sp. URHB0044]|jgi:hypothetical protein|uniref:hypothetical protein n=1 Tax=Mycobacterium sp. URHB0044 TaxID=1380386 RepID=UPI0012DD4441|nr:hypothetical protein [Mycobacterium sp. URHB0044]
MTSPTDAAGFQDLVEHYNGWRAIYRRAGKPPRNEPAWVDGALWLRDGYPHPDWTAFVIEPQVDGFKVYQASTERRIEPVLSYQGFFSRLQDAGKFVIAAVGDYLRIHCRLDPISWIWMDQGLHPGVEEDVMSDSEVRYRLRSDHGVYCIMMLGDRPVATSCP